MRPCLCDARDHGNAGAGGLGRVVVDAGSSVLSTASAMYLLLQARRFETFSAAKP